VGALTFSPPFERTAGGGAPAQAISLTALAGLSTTVGASLSFSAALSNPTSLPLVGTPETASGLTGTPSPGTVTWALGDLNKAFTYVWAAAGSSSIRVRAADGTLSNTLPVTIAPAPSPPPPPPPSPTLATLSGSSTATVGVAHTDTVTLDLAADQTYTVTWARSDSATGPATSTIATGQTTATGSSTWGAAGTGRTVDFTISPVLTRAGRPVTVAVSAAPSPPSPPANTGTQTLTLARSTTGTVPVQFGLGWARGDVTDVVCTGLTSYRVEVLRRWADGSVKHARVNGRVALTASVPLTVTASNGTSPTGGSALTAADIQAASPSVTIQCGAIGTLTLSTLLGSPVRTLYSTSEAVECHYWAAIGSTGLHGWVYVRLHADGRMRVRCAVENGYLDNGAGATYSGSAQTYDLTVTIGGVVELATAGYAHYLRAAAYAEGWIGGDPAVTIGHDVAYLRMLSRLVPQYYVFGSPSEGALAALTQTYGVSSSGPQTPSMGNTGYQPSIGLLPNWEAMYLTSGDVRALRCTIAGALSVRNYPVAWREQATRSPVRPSVYPTWSPGGPGVGGQTEDSAGGLTWEIAHHPSAGYLAYLLTADYAHYETMQLQAATAWLYNSVSKGSGTSRVLNNQERAVAWQLRTYGQLCAIAPSADLASGFLADARSLLSYQYSYYAARITSQPADMASKGCLYVYSYAYAPAGIAPWMTDFWVAANGHISELEPLASNADLLTVRNHMYRWVVGRLGVEGDSTAYPFTHGASYSLQVATSASDSAWRSTWGDIYTAEWGLTNSTTTNTLTGSGAGVPTQASYGYWGNLLPALAYAVDHGAPGAADAMERLRSASNWSDITGSGFGDLPGWGVMHKGYAAPAWAPAAGTWANIGSSGLTLVASRPTGWPSSESAGPDQNWCGAVYAPDIGRRGAVVKHGSGHLNDGDPLWGGVWVLDLDAASITGRNVPSSPLIDYSTTFFSHYNSFYESTDSATVGFPYAPHVYNGLALRAAAAGGGDSGVLHRVGVGGGTTTCVHAYDLSSASAPPVRVRDSIATLAASSGGYPATAVDEDAGGYWVMGMNGQGGLSLLGWDGSLIASYTGIQFNEQGYYSLLKIPAPWNCLLAFGQATSGYYGSNSLGMKVCPLVSNVPQGWTTVTQAGAVPTDVRIGGDWSRILRKVVGMIGGGDTAVKTLTLPSPTSLTSGTYTWTDAALTSGDGSPIAQFGINPNNGLPYTNNGSFGRLVEAYHARCLIWWNGVNNRPQAIRLPGM